MTTDNFNPYEAPSESHANSGITRIPEELALFETSAKAGNKAFRILAYEDRLQVLSESGEVFDVLRTEPLFCKIMDSGFVKRAITMKLLKPTLLMFEKENFDRLKDWIGLPRIEDLKWAAGGTSFWQIIVGLLFLVGGDILGLVVGVALIGSWIVSRVKPHRGLFLMYVAFFIVATYINGQRAYEKVNAGEVPIFSVLFLLFCVMAAISHFRNFSKYRVLQTDTQKNAA